MEVHFLVSSDSVANLCVTTRGYNSSLSSVLACVTVSTLAYGISLVYGYT